MDRIHKGRFYATLHLSPGVLLKLNCCSPAMRTHNRVRDIHTPAQTWTLHPSPPTLSQDLCRLWHWSQQTKSVALYLVIKLRPRQTSICGKCGICSNMLQGQAFIYRWCWWGGMWPLIWFLTWNEIQSCSMEKAGKGKNDKCEAENSLYLFMSWIRFFNLGRFTCLHVRHVSAKVMGGREDENKGRE